MGLLPGLANIFTLNSIEFHEIHTKPWAILSAIFGVGGAFYFITAINRTFYSYGVTCCGECVFLTFLIVASVIAIIAGTFGMFKNDTNQPKQE